MTLQPFFTFYGGKWRTAPSYPRPRHQIIIEPFAGSAGYAVRHYRHNVVLVEKNPDIAATWRYLIGATSLEILSLPNVSISQRIDTLDICRGAQLLIGWWCNKGSSRPKLRPSLNMRRSMVKRAPRDPPSGWWGPAVKARLAAQVKLIRHWTIIEGDYTKAPDVEATWFIDPPYAKAGKHYDHGPSRLNYDALGEWCRSRKGQTIVCEQQGASWLPFEPFRSIKSQGGRSKEVLWLDE